MRVEESRSRCGYHDWATTCRVGEVWSNFRDQIIRNRNPIEHGGDEGGGATESLAHNDAVSDKNVVAVISHD